jgi:hypothetical protein
VGQERDLARAEAVICDGAVVEDPDPCRSDLDCPDILRQRSWLMVIGNERIRRPVAW